VKIEEGKINCRLKFEVGDEQNDENEKDEDNGIAAEIEQLRKRLMPLEVPQEQLERKIVSQEAKQSNISKKESRSRTKGNSIASSTILDPLICGPKVM
jgi:predicted nuclease with TOPRIM domain